METIFTIQPEHLDHFDNEVKAVKLWQELLWAEAYRINLPLGNVNITEKTIIHQEIQDKVTDEFISTPHVHDPHIAGGVRTAEPDEMPK